MTIPTTEIETLPPAAAVLAAMFLAVQAEGGPAQRATVEEFIADVLALGLADDRIRQVMGRPITFFFTSTPTSDEVLLLYPAIENVTFADDFSGSLGRVGVNPTATFVLTVLKNGVAVGTITISTVGAVTFATTGGVLSLVPGDVLAVVAPSVVDATIKNVSITMAGEI